MPSPAEFDKGDLPQAYYVLRVYLEASVLARNPSFATRKQASTKALKFILHQTIYNSKGENQPFPFILMLVFRACVSIYFYRGREFKARWEVECVFDEFDLVEVGNQNEGQQFVTWVHSNLNVYRGKEKNLFNKQHVRKAMTMNLTF